MNVEDASKFTKALFERDRDSFDLNGMIDRVEKRCPVPELAQFLCGILREVGPEIFEAGFYAGAAAGLELARDINKHHR